MSGAGWIGSPKHIVAARRWALPAPAVTARTLPEVLGAMAEVSTTPPACLAEVPVRIAP